MRDRTVRFVCSFLLLMMSVSCQDELTIQGVYLSFDSVDTSTNMVVHFFGRSDSYVYYDSTSGGGEPERYAKRVKTSRQSVPGLSLSLHSVSLTQLEPDQTYYFIL